MEVPFSMARARRSVWPALAWLPTVVLGLLLWGPALAALRTIWHSDPAVSLGPFMVALALGHLWLRRREIRRAERASAAGLALLVLSSLTYLATSWADIAFLRWLALIAMTAGAIWFIGGDPSFRASAGALTFLVFMLPWPTSLTAHLAFPLQLMSSAYAAMLTGIAGVPVHREGVQLFILPDAGSHLPRYDVLVAHGCSGLTSMIVLLALGYLIAYHTPLRPGWRALLFASVVPLALVTNAVRLTFVLLAGAYHGAGLAKQIHDHEAPVLIFFCSAGLMALRHALLTWTRPDGEGGTAGAATPATVHP